MDVGANPAAANARAGAVEDGDPSLGSGKQFAFDLYT